MKSAIIYISLFLSLALSGCISEFNANLPSQENNLLVVEGDIVSDTVVIFTLNKTYSMNEPASNEIVNPVIWATLTVIDDNGGESLPALYLGGSKYQLAIGKLDENRSYALKIEYEEDVYLSELSKPVSTPEIDEVKALQPIDRGDVHLCVSTHDKEAGARYFMWSYVEDWEISAHYDVELFFDPRTRQFYELDYNPVFYCWKNNRLNSLLLGTSEALVRNQIVDNELVIHSPTNERFSLLYSILVSQKAISKSAYEYYLNKRKTNEEMGGLFTPQPSDFYGNITCQTDPLKRAIGYVEVIKNITQKRIFVNGYAISKPYIRNNCDIISADSVTNLITEYQLGNGYFDVYNMLYLRPVVKLLSPAYPLLPENWSTVECTDCTVHGSKNKPDFWPNDHR